MVEEPYTAFTRAYYYTVSNRVVVVVRRKIITFMMIIIIIMKINNRHATERFSLTVDGVHCRLERIHVYTAAAREDVTIPGR